MNEDLEKRIKLINELSEIIQRLTDKEFPMSVDYALGRCLDIYSNSIETTNNKKEQR